MINICFITDKKYVIATMTAIKSLILSNKNEYLSINVLCYKISNDECNQILKLRTKKAEINIIDVSDKVVDICEECRYVSKSALLKFYLPDIFPNSDKILYLDGDILVKRSVKNFYETDLGNCYAAVVKDIYATKIGSGKSLNLENYFNSGVMLLNLNKMRKDNITTKLIEYKKNEKMNRYMDQDAFNCIFASNVIYQSLKYNYIQFAETQYTEEEFMNFYEINKKELNNIKNKPVIIHMAGFYKPWEYTFAELFTDYMVYLYKLPKSKIKDLTLDHLLGNNKGMRLKYFLKQFKIITFFIDIYLNFKLS